MGEKRRLWCGMVVAMLAAVHTSAWAQDPAEQVLPVRMDVGWAPEAPFCARAAERVVYGRVGESSGTPRLEVVRSIDEGPDEVSILQPHFLNKTRFSRYARDGVMKPRVGEHYLVFVFAHPEGVRFVHPRCVEVGPYDALPEDVDARLALQACWRRTTATHVASLLETPAGAETVARCLAGVDYEAASPAALLALGRVLVEGGGRPLQHGDAGLAAPGLAEALGSVVRALEPHVGARRVRRPAWMPASGRALRSRARIPAPSDTAGGRSCDDSEDSVACAEQRFERADALYEALRRGQEGLTERKVKHSEWSPMFKSDSSTAGQADALLSSIHEDPEQPIALRTASLVRAGQLVEVLGDKVGAYGLNQSISVPEIFPLDPPEWLHPVRSGKSQIYERARDLYRAALALSADPVADEWSREARAGLRRLQVFSDRPLPPVRMGRIKQDIEELTRTLHSDTVLAIGSLGYPLHRNR